MRVLIVDDFPADRLILGKMIREFHDPDIEICAECANGMEAIEKAKELLPDICLCDINMPKMNGFQFAKALRMEHVDSKIIFCSMYRDFEYAKEAMYLDSYGYVLKPVDPQELYRCIKKASGSISYQNQVDSELQHLHTLLKENRPILMENFIRDVMTGINRDRNDIRDKVTFYELDFCDGKYAMLLVEIDDFDQITGELTVEKKQLLSMRVFNRGCKAAEGSLAFASARMDDSHFALLFHTAPDADEEYSMEQIKKCCKDMISYFEETDISISCALSTIYPDITETPGRLEQCQYIMRYKFTLGKGRVLMQEDISPDPILDTTDFNALRRDIQYLLNTGSQEEVRLFVEGLLKPSRTEKGRDYVRNTCYFVIMCIQIMANEQNVTLAEIFGEDNMVWLKLSQFETIFDTKNWLKNLMTFAGDYLREKALNQESTVVRRVKEYIKERLNEDLKLETIAKDIFYTPNYLNRVFKNITGETISDYIVRQRVEKAKEMLLDPQMKLYEIAEAMRYSHTAYFSSVFKKYTGMNPKEYRDRFMGKS